MGRGLEIATAVALGVVSLVTALGVLQASVWTSDAARFGQDASDARDQSVSIAVVAQLRQRADYGATLAAERLARLQDAAVAAGDYTTALQLEADLSTELIASGLRDEFDAWRQAGFPDDANPAQSAEYLAQNSGEAQALVLTSQRLGALGKELSTRATIFAQAAVIHALALFLFGVAGINRLRLARYVTLGVGAAVFLFGLLVMVTAY